MTSFERFKIEVDGIVKTIQSYSGESKISNFIEQLREAVNVGNKEKILYCLNRIQEWYNQTSAEIASNEFVSSSEHRGHAENRRLISEFIDLLEKEDESEFTSISPDVKGNADSVLSIHAKWVLCSTEMSIARQA